MHGTDLRKSGKEGLPNYQEYQRENPENILVHLVLRFNRSCNKSRGSVSLANPSKLGADQKYKSKKKTRQKSPNMCKVVHMWKNPHCQINDDDEDKSQQRCQLNISQLN